MHETRGAAEESKGVTGSARGERAQVSRRGQRQLPRCFGEVSMSEVTGRHAVVLWPVSGSVGGAVGARLLRELRALER